MSAGYNARILADSISKSGHRLTTMEVTFPRIILSEFNTHRVLSRNSASSRAIPTKKQLEMITMAPFIPLHWGQNQSGMQAEKEVDDKARARAIRIWISACHASLDFARRLLDIGVHKQLTNRLLEPFMWHTVIVTATEWDNFFALRANPAAQPEIRTIAEMMQEAYGSSEPQLLQDNQWHLPLIQPDERGGVFELSEKARKISAARCARVSYLTHSGTRDLQADLALYDRLVDGGHMSPLEHVATPFSDKEWQARRAMKHAARSVSWDQNNSNVYGLSNLCLRQLAETTEFNGNFRGWTQLRKLVKHENDFSAR